MNELPPSREPRLLDKELDQAVATIRQEITGLRELEQALSNGLRGPFEAMLRQVLKTRGRVVLSGMGKSGHIARKIAATLSSTGTPAQFVHPAEAAHGDLGMLTRNDTLIIISKSGKSAELQPLLTYAGNNRIPLVAITSNADSPLARTANFLLLLPDIAEACPLKLAPTTSTTMQLALGDALAMSLLVAHGFTREQFFENHPGGELGLKLTPLEEVMHKGDELPLVRPETSMQDTLITMTSKHFGCAGIIDDEGCLVGIITDGDLRRAMEDHPGDLLKLTAGEVMTRNPRTLSKDTFAAIALGYLNENKITVVFVTNEHNKPEGIVHIHDLLRQEGQRR